MLATVENGGPVLNQGWVNIACLLCIFVLILIFQFETATLLFSPRRGGGVRRVRPMLDPPLSSTVLGNADIKETLLPFCELTDMSSHVIPKRTIHKIN